jgi:monoamine oxidase
MKDIIIIGAGASGLKAAHTLAKHHKSVIVLEARSRMGGRIHTLTEPFSFPVDLGAEFIHGDLPMTHHLLREAGIDTLTMKGQAWRVLQGKLEKSGMAWDGWDELLAALHKLKQDITMGDFLRAHFSDEKYADLISSVSRFVEGYDAADLDKVSAFALRDEWSAEEESTQYFPDGGYHRLAQYLFEQASSKGVEFVFNCEVTRIEWREGKVTVSSNQATYEASRVLITLPIGVLQSGTIAFSPDIPEYIHAFKGFGYGTVTKILVEFDTPIWSQPSREIRSIPALGFLFSDAFVPTWWVHDDQMPLLTGWLAGPKLEKITLGKAELQQRCIESLSYIFDCTEEVLKKHIKTLKIVDWHKDPFAKGAYAYATLQTNDARKILNTPVQNTLYFAGEALYEGPEMGTVEAALGSGEFTAHKMAVL